MDFQNSLSAILDQSIPEDTIKTILESLHARGETADDICALVAALRTRMTTISAPSPVIDCCGTGGDGAHSLNVSTAVSFVVAGAGVRVAKHGNRSATSKSGAADVLESLGININAPASVNADALQQIGFCFLMAPHYHPALKPLVPIRKSIGHRTIFNLVGPLLNPALVDHQLIGVYDRKWILPFAEVLQKLGGTKRAMIVHSDDGLDEISLSAPTHYALFDSENGITEGVITQDDFGLPYIDKSAISGSDAEYNALALLRLLNGEMGGYRDTVLANAAACFVVVGRAKNLKDGVDIARHSIDDGRALEIFETYKEFVKTA